MKSTPIYFAHANGIPAKCYEPFLRQFSPANYAYINCLGHGEYKVSKKDSWAPLVDEVLADIESRYQQPVLGLGHSLGGYTLLEAAERRPDLFTQVIVMEPPMFPKKMRSMMHIFRILGLSDALVPVVKKAKNRTEKFESREFAREYFSSRSFFDEFHEESFELYLEEGLTDMKEGVGLTFSKQVEYDVFKYFPKVFLTRKNPVSSHFFYSTGSNLVPNFNFEELKALMPFTTFVPFEKGTHMFPLEYPAELSGMIKEILLKQ
ncbi:MAG: alpha/beta hydrolase [Bacteroidota bacterium]